MTHIHLAEEVVQRLISSPFFQKSKNMSCYLSMPSGELDTSSLVTEILRSGSWILVHPISAADSSIR